MSFYSYEFIFLFLPITLAAAAGFRWIGNHCSGKKYGAFLYSLFLIGISLLFFGWNDPAGLPILIASIVLNYICGRLCGFGKHRSICLTTGLFLNLGTLAFFKYTGIPGHAPLGISFFTFTQIAYLMECYRGTIKEIPFTEYSVYVTFFPKLAQGPIALPDDFLLQLSKGQISKALFKTIDGVNWERIYRCLALFIFGLFKKVLLADTLGKAVDWGYASLSSLSSGDGLIVMLSYTLQLYFDFSGYCDMAMGIAGLFGIELPLNFDSPYKACDIIDFWSRWHITLTRFFTRYLYIPLGGNRKGKVRTYLNCLIVFFLSGIWHGAGLTFIIWGLMHGILYVITRARKDFRKPEMTLEKPKKTALEKFRKPVGVLLTFVYVNIAWIFFRAPSVKDALTLLKTIFRFSFGKINPSLIDCFHMDEFWYMIKVLKIDQWQYAHGIIMALVLGASLLIVFAGKNAFRYVKDMKPGICNTLLLVLLLVWSVFSFSGVSSFLYVNF